MIKTKPIKPKPCAHCGSIFRPQSMAQSVCSPICAIRYVRAQKKAEIKQVKDRKAAIKTIPELKSMLQIVLGIRI